ncbi:tudor domain-containing protein 7-like [Melopsittacus undulatus]|uniref:tudor domain-containing protein 7-like n=1 Tax=Melopsittacus undulatus TaxID=13146 RepID=UPI001243504E|nr:tudor domain-containing protein 7-like [Melopsittacus undulatus]
MQGLFLLKHILKECTGADTEQGWAFWAVACVPRVLEENASSCPCRLLAVEWLKRLGSHLLCEVICHAVACSETEPIAQLVARQRSSKRKTGRQVNCQMRLKNTSPVKLAGKPKGTLRQPRSLSVPEEGSKRPVPRLPRSRGVAGGVVKPTVESARLALSAAAGSGPPKEMPMQRHVTVVNSVALIC